MVKLYVRLKTAEYWNHVRGTSIGTKFKYFWRKGWQEIPVVMASVIISVLGSSIIVTEFCYAAKQDFTPKYYRTPRIYRPDDPEVKNIRRVSAFDL